MAHVHYKGTRKVHSFRGLLEDNKQRQINIEGSVGAIAWRITKFQLLSKLPGDYTNESIIKIYREQQSSVTAEINFDDSELLAAGNYVQAVTATPTTSTIIFDNALFVRDIWVTHVETNSSAACNYYIELEEVKVSAAGMAQLAVAAARRNRFTSE